MKLRDILSFSIKNLFMCNRYIFCRNFRGKESEEKLLSLSVKTAEKREEKNFISVVIRKIKTLLLFMKKWAEQSPIRISVTKTTGKTVLKLNLKRKKTALSSGFCFIPKSGKDIRLRQ